MYSPPLPFNHTLTPLLSLALVSVLSQYSTGTQTSSAGRHICKIISGAIQRWSLGGLGYQLIKESGPLYDTSNVLQALYLSAVLTFTGATVPEYTSALQPPNMEGP